MTHTELPSQVPPADPASGAVPPDAAGKPAAAVAPAAPPPRRRFLARGESAIAGGGLAITATFICAMVAAALWTNWSQRKSMAGARRDEVNLAANSLWQSAESLLSAGDVSALRRLVNDTAHTAKMTRCEITLPDGGVLASSEPGRINVRHLPDPWPVGSVPLDAPAADAKTVTITHPLKVEGRGRALLTLTAPTDVPNPAATHDATAGVGMIGAAALVSLWFVYRNLRHRLRGIGAVREALLAGGAGENDFQALAVGLDFGPEARAWNHFIHERERLEARVLVCQAREMRHDRRGADKGDLEGAFDAMSQGLLLLDEQLRAKFVNGAAAVFLQSKRDDLLGAEASKFIADEKVLKAIEEVATGATRRRTTLEVKQGAGVLKFSVRPVRREDSAAAMVVIEDVTQQRVADEARNTFVAQATHELRTPLTNIRLYVEQAIDEGETDPALRTQALNVINQEARRLENIVGEMLSVSEIEAGCLKLHKGDVRLDQLFAELQADFGAQAVDKRLTLTFNLPPKLPAIQGDGDKLRLSLHNLVGNALKYTPPNGTVTVNVNVTASEFRVEVADTGIGIGPDEQARVFEKFYRAKDERVARITGTGLGLTLAREVVRLHGGDITLDSQLNKGSTFTLSLPIKLEGI